jgi:hypothetical protein
MIRCITLFTFLFVSIANAQLVGPIGGGASSALTLSQFALAPGSLGSPGGTMASYVAGDTITLACTGVTFATAPIIGVAAVSGGAVTDAIVSFPGVVTGTSTLGSSLNCLQASTSGSGTGFTITASMGVIASYLSMPSLSTGGAPNNGNFFLNTGNGDTNPGNAGSENTFLGDKSGYALTGNSSFNTTLGHNACGNGGTAVTSGNNTCVGQDAGRNFQGNASNGSNTLVGAGAGRNVAGGWNTWIGMQAGGTNGTNTAGNLSGFNNVGAGFNVGAGVTSGAGLLLLGTKAGSGITTGSGDIILGATTGNDNCANGNETNVFAVCPGAGRVLTITGGGTPSTSAGAFAGTLAITTLATATGSFLCGASATAISIEAVSCAASDAAVKHDINIIDPSEAIKVFNKRGVRFTYNEGKGTSGRQIGVIANEWERDFPELITRDDDGTRHFNYQGAFGVAVAALSNLNKRLAKLEHKSRRH